MSIIGHNALNKIVNEYKITRPSEILDQLNVEVSNTLHQQSESSVHDGMDLALIRINRSTNSIQYSAAFNPLYIIRGNELLEYRGNRFSIGKIRKNRKFENHEIQLEDGDVLYMFSDGYADQFGGADEKKFKASAVKNLLMKIKDKPMDEQKDILNDTIEDWRGTIEQVDDILFIGRKYRGH
jgi:serine phosphatase RsbU (regulator of sigma subunit)